MAASQWGSTAVTEVRAVGGASIGEILRLLSGGTAGEILLALRDGPLQTKVLTHRVKGYTARTIYRYLPRLADLGLVERNDEPDGSARVLHTLSGEAGEELASLIDRYATASMKRLPGGQIDSSEWASLGLLADVWEAGVVEALSRGPTSPTELTRGLRCLSYHQLIRRASRFKQSGFFCEAPQSPRQRRCYRLSHKACRAMGLVVGIGRWRRRHLAPVADGLSAAEMATVLRTLLLSPETHQAEEASFHVKVEAEVIELRSEAGVAWAAGGVGEWMRVLLDGERCAECGGDSALVRKRLANLYRELWTPA